MPPVGRRRGHARRNSLAFLRQSTNARTRAFRRRHFPDVTTREWNDWRWQSRHRIRTLAQLEKMLRLSDEEREALVQGGTMLPVGITPYYMSLLDADDPRQPLRRTVVPTLNEFVRTEGEADDPLGEDSHSPVPGLVHRYPDRVLLLPLDFCSTYCRYCTRSRVVGHGELMPQESRLMAAFDYLRRTPQIRDVLISGGDALALGDDKLEWILRQLAGDPEHRVHPHRHEDAGRVAAADHARAVPHVAAVSSDLDEPALHPSGRMHARSGPGLRPAGRRRHSARLADGAAQGRERQRRDDAAADAQAAADARAAVLFVPVRSDQRLVALPHAGVARAWRSSKACAATRPATPCRRT